MQLGERWTPPKDAAWKTQHPVGSIIALLSAAHDHEHRSAESLGHVARALAHIGVIDHVVSADTLRKYVVGCADGCVEGPSYDPKNKGKALKRHIAALVPIAQLIRAREKELLLALRCTEEEPEADGDGFSGGDAWGHHCHYRRYLIFEYHVAVSYVAPRIMRAHAKAMTCFAIIHF